MSRATEIVRNLEAFRSVEPAAAQRGRYLFAQELGKSFVGLSPAGRAALIVPLSNRASVAGQTTSGLSLRAYPDLEFDVAGRIWRAPSAVLECTDPALEETFAVLAIGIADQLGAKAGEPTWQEVDQVVRGWHRLLGSKRVLSPEEEVGLWGELWFIVQSRHLDVVATYWRGPLGEECDFVNDTYGIECKTTLTELHHHVSQRQVEVRPTPHRICIMSLCIEPGGSDGMRLPELIEVIRGRIGNRQLFEQRLAGTRYSDSHSEGYKRSFTVRGAPMLFDRRDVPQVRHADLGVSNLRYEVQLRTEASLCTEDAQPILESFWHAPNSPGLNGTTS